MAKDSDFEARSRREEQYFQRLADGAPVMIWMSGLDMGCFYFNSAWLEFRGRSLKEEEGNGWAEGVHPEDLDRCVNFYISCFKQRSPFAMTYRLMNARGEYRHILDRGAPHYLEDGTFLGFHGGCAELENSAADRRNAEIRSSLQAVASYAKQLATEARAAAREETPSLQVAVSRLQAKHRAEPREQQYAAEQMRKLASDMLSYHGIDRAACLK